MSISSVTFQFNDVSYKLEDQTIISDSAFIQDAIEKNKSLVNTFFALLRKPPEIKLNPNETYLTCDRLKNLDNFSRGQSNEIMDINKTFLLYESASYLGCTELTKRIINVASSILNMDTLKKQVNDAKTHIETAFCVEVLEAQKPLSNSEKIGKIASPLVKERLSTQEETVFTTFITDFFTRVTELESIKLALQNKAKKLDASELSLDSTSIYIGSSISSLDDICWGEEIDNKQKWLRVQAQKLDQIKYDNALPILIQNIISGLMILIDIHFLLKIDKKYHFTPFRQIEDLIFLYKQENYLHKLQNVYKNMYQSVEKIEEIKEKFDSANFLSTKHYFNHLNKKNNNNLNMSLHDHQDLYTSEKRRTLIAIVGFVASCVFSFFLVRNKLWKYMAGNLQSSDKNVAYLFQGSIAYSMAAMLTVLLEKRRASEGRA